MVIKRRPIHHVQALSFSVLHIPHLAHLTWFMFSITALTTINILYLHMWGRIFSTGKIQHWKTFWKAFRPTSLVMWCGPCLIPTVVDLLIAVVYCHAFSIPVFKDIICLQILEQFWNKTNSVIIFLLVESRSGARISFPLSFMRLPVKQWFSLSLHCHLVASFF